jgi:hypothetical protein
MPAGMPLSKAGDLQEAPPMGCVLSGARWRAGRICAEVCVLLRTRWRQWLMLLWLGLSSLLARAETVTYPQSGSPGDARDVYPIKLLQMALDKAGTTPYVLQVSDVPMLQARSFLELAHGNRLRVAWGMTSIERETKLLPIRIPIFKGLIGWRLALVREDRSEAFDTVHDVQGLRRLVAGQGHDWPDTAILRGNGMEVIGVPGYDSLFRMLAAGRFDYLPRSMVEIWAEEEQHRKEGIVIDQHLLIRYRTAFYFFTNKSDTGLADTIRTGLERAIADGSFDKLFCAQYAPEIARAKLVRRTVVDLVNPFLPPETPLARKELWFTAGSCSANK